jgi:hypothetical protein
MISWIFGGQSPPYEKKSLQHQLLIPVSRSAVVGFRLSKYHRQLAGWIECNEIQQSLDLAQPNLQMLIVLNADT